MWYLVNQLYSSIEVFIGWRSLWLGCGCKAAHVKSFVPRHCCSRSYRQNCNTLTSGRTIGDVSSSLAKTARVRSDTPSRAASASCTAVERASKGIYPRNERSIVVVVFVGCMQNVYSQ